MNRIPGLMATGFSSMTPVWRISIFFRIWTEILPGCTVWLNRQMSFKDIDIFIDKKGDIFIDIFLSHAYNKRNGIIKETRQGCIILF